LTTEQCRALMFMCHWALGVGTRDRDSTHVYRASRSITRQGIHLHLHHSIFNNHLALSAPPRHAKSSGTTRRRQWTPGCTAAPRRITPVLLVNALRLDIRGVPEPCLWPAQHTVHTYITAHRVVTVQRVRRL
jgi:hypothetical protein